MVVYIKYTNDFIKPNILIIKNKRNAVLPLYADKNINVKKL
jgi:hypothetical protein